MYYTAENGSCLDGASRIRAVEVVEAMNDAEALVEAAKLDEGLSREIWERDRLVGRIEARLPSSPS
jgi:hypothetical protein